MKAIVNYDMTEGSTVRYLIYDNVKDGGYTVALMAGNQGVPLRHWNYETLIEAARKAGITEWTDGVDAYYGGKVDTRSI